MDLFRSRDGYIGMLRRTASLQFLLSRSKHNSRDLPSMALHRSMLAVRCCGLGQSSPNSHKDNGLSGRYGFYSGKGLRFKVCSEKQDSVFGRVREDLAKACAVTINHRSLRDVDVGVGLDMAVEFVNGQATPKNGRSVGFPNHPLPAKLVVAVDVDEVLGSFLLALNKFIADRYCSNHSVSEYYVYEFFRVWNCSRSEANLRVHEFFKTPYFKEGIHPIPGARRVLGNLSHFCNLSIVTSRQNVIKDHTLEWIEKHYPGLFNEIHFGNHFALGGQSRPKSEICRSIGAQVLIDDNPRYALECAEAGIKVLLFDYHNSYPWSKSDSADLHPLVTRVHNWEDVEANLALWIVAH